MDEEKMVLSAVVFQPQEPGKDLIFLGGTAMELNNFELSPEMIRRIQMLADMDMTQEELNEKVREELIEQGANENDIIVRTNRNTGMDR